MEGWELERKALKGRAHDTQTLTACKYAHRDVEAIEQKLVLKFVGNQRLPKGGRKCNTSFKEAKGGERGLRRSTFVTSGDFSPKASKKAQRAIIDTKGTLIDERPFSQCERPFKVAKGMRDEGRKEREGRVRETHRPSRHARAAA